MKMLIALLLLVLIAGLEVTNGARIMLNKAVRPNDLLIAPEELLEPNHNLKISSNENRTLDGMGQGKEDGWTKNAEVFSLRRGLVGPKERILQSTPSPGDGH
ncbi:hypothetical protein SUGI_0253550 [Cryptomeria japonica]|nr:hypothetical protein SUGI_0253550 [Cryptomeria japonica]